jgi:hypothetical protein
MSALTTALNDPQQDIDKGADTSLRTSSSVDTKNDWSNVMVAAWYGSDEVRAP